MIIFGTRGVKSTIKEGNFSCPQCASEKPFRHRKVTRFFTLYFIPLIPLGRVGEYVECRGCRGTFIPRVLELSPSKTNDDFTAIYEKAIKHSMVLIMLADGRIDASEKDQVLAIINKFSHNDITMSDLEKYIVEVQNNNQDISTYLKKISSSLNEHGKEVVIKCALLVAAADGNIDQSELDLIAKMGQSLEMPGSHIKGIISEMFEENAAIKN